MAIVASKPMKALTQLLTGKLNCYISVNLSAQERKLHSVTFQNIQKYILI